MQSILLKFLSVFTFLKHPKILKAHRYYIRDNYYSNLRQNIFFLRDSVFKNKYKTIQYYGEFQQELTYVLPFAYWHFLNGTLKKTISCKDTKELYFFSHNHEEKHTRRDSKFDYESFEIPNKTHSIAKNFQKWVMVPLKERYRNDVFVFDKPILIIANKFNMEWDNSPINYLDIPILDQIIHNTKEKYQIIYNRPSSSHIVLDNSEILDLKEYQWLAQVHPQVICMKDLYEKHKALVSNFNHLQLMVYSNCTKYISVHGGTATLASYFGGVNIILSDPTWSMENRFNEFESVFPKLSGAKILHAKARSEIITYLNDHY